MLKTLDIQNIALIEKASLTFQKGLTVLTGETGAGKSVIVTALSLILGGRTDRDIIRHGEDFCIVEAVFNVSSMPATYKSKFADYIQDNCMHFYREIHVSGKHKITISNVIATLTELRDVTAPLAEILGQHANQQLMHEENHLEFLDNFANLSEFKTRVHDAYHNWKEVADNLKKTKAKRDTYKNERELLLFQQKEISDADIQIGETENLLTEKKILDASRTLMSSASMISDTIENDEVSSLSLLQLALKELEKMHEFDLSLSKQVEELTDVIYRIGDIKQFIDSYGSSIVDDPHRIEEINSRLDELYMLKKKYGGSEESVLSALENIHLSLQKIPKDIDTYIEELERENQKLFQIYCKEAVDLSETRKKAAEYLEKLVTKELLELSISNSGFKLEFLYEDDSNGVPYGDRFVKPTENGLETAQILFTANIGEPLKSLVKTASGGEISRVLLALKSAEKKNKQLPYSLLVFDEVDAGIGGQTAVDVAKKIKKLSSDNQLLVVTHLHQIARVADNHFTVQKTTDNKKRTVISVVSLDPIGVESELKRMIALPENA